MNEEKVENKDSVEYSVPEETPAATETAESVSEVSE